MGQVHTFPRTISFTRQFEELPLFVEKTEAGDVFCAGLVDGNLEISFDQDGEWTITDIHINVHDYKTGYANRAKTVRVDADENAALYWLLLDVLTDKYADTIREWIALEAEECGLRIAA